MAEDSVESRMPELKPRSMRSSKRPLKRIAQVVEDRTPAVEEIAQVVEDRTPCQALVSSNDLRLNADIVSGDFRFLNLQRAPFRFPAPRFSMWDNAVAADRVLAGWEVANLPARHHRPHGDSKR
jgi:hypothetical protein